MYENMTVLSNEEYAELAIKAHKYDQLRAICVAGTFATTEEEIIFEITKKEKNEMKERRKQ